MHPIEARNRQFLSDLFGGPFRGHAIWFTPPDAPTDDLGDFAISDRPVSQWLPVMEQRYQRQVEWMEALQDDSVPYVGLNTNTAVFAAAFGCRVHVYGDSPAAARPLVRTPQEADRLREPSLEAPTLSRILELGELMRERLGPEACIGVPDVQSPLDIAALIWNKQDFYTAIMDTPDAVQRLVGRCHRLLKRFLTEFRARFPNSNLCHCPRAWAPPHYGCWLSEDEAGAMSTAMFEEFCLPSLVDLSRTFGGLFVHCCAAADHQYESFKKIPNLRGLNRVFQAPGPRPALEAFDGSTVHMLAFTTLEGIEQTLGMALPKNRFLMNPPAESLEEARRIHDRLRARCPRR